MEDTFNLNRFVIAQEPVFLQVLAELRAGAKMLGFKRSFHSAKFIVDERRTNRRRLIPS